MGVNSLIMWAVIDPVMRAVITETWASSLAFYRWSNAWETRTSNSALRFIWDAGFGPCILILQWCWDATFELCVLVIVVTLRHRFQPSRLGAALVAMLPYVWSLDTAFWWLNPSDFWIVYKTPSKVFDILRLTGTDFKILWTLIEFMFFMIGLTIIWNALSLILSGMLSSWVHCKTLWSHQRWSWWVCRYAVQTSSVLWAGCCCLLLNQR